MYLTKEYYCDEVIKKAFGGIYFCMHHVRSRCTVLLRYKPQYLSIYFLLEPRLHLFFSPCLKAVSLVGIIVNFFFLS